MIRNIKHCRCCEAVTQPLTGHSETTSFNCSLASLRITNEKHIRWRHQCIQWFSGLLFLNVAAYCYVTTDASATPSSGPFSQTFNLSQLQHNTTQFICFEAGEHALIRNARHVDASRDIKPISWTNWQNDHCKFTVCGRYSVPASQTIEIWDP